MGIYSAYLSLCPNEQERQQFTSTQRALTSFKFISTLSLVLYTCCLSVLYIEMLSPVDCLLEREIHKPKQAFLFWN